MQVVYFGCGEDVVNFGLVFEQHEGENVAGICEVFRSVDVGGEIFLVDVLAEVEAASAGEPFVSHVAGGIAESGDIPAAPAFGDWACRGGGEIAPRENGLAFFVWEDRADEEAGDIFGAGAGVAGEALTVADEPAFFGRRREIERIEHHAGGVVSGDDLYFAAGDEADVEVGVEVESAGVFRGDKITLEGGF